MEKNQITLTRSEAKEIRNHLFQTASDLELLAQFERGGMKISLLRESETIKNIAKAINDCMQTKVTFTLTHKLWQ